MRLPLPIPDRPPSVPDAKLMMFLFMVVVPAVGGHNLLIDRRVAAASAADLLGWLAITVASGGIACSGIPLLNRLRRFGWPSGRWKITDWVLFYGLFVTLFALGAALRSLVAPLVLAHHPLSLGHRIALASNLIVIYLAVMIGLEYIAGRRDTQLALQAERRSVMAHLAESRSQLVATEDRRHKDLAEFLHGVVQTRLLMAWAQLGQAKDDMGKDRQESQRLLQQSRAHLTSVRQATLSEVRELLGATDDDTPFEVLASAIVERFTAVLPLKFELRVDALALTDRLDPVARLAAVRLLEESLQNVLKHACARRVRVCVSRTPHEMLVRVEDDGKGFEPDMIKSGVGLGGLVTSLVDAGGSCHVESRPRKGTSVVIWMPVRPETAAAVDPRNLP